MSLLTKSFQKVKYLNIEARFTYLSLNLLHNVYNKRAPDYMCTLTLVTECHHHNTRNSLESYVLPSVNSHGLKTFMYQTAKSWNSLPNVIKSIKSKNMFKSKCKSYLFKLMDDKEKCEFVM